MIAYAQDMNIVATNGSNINFGTPITNFLDESLLNKYNSMFEIKYNGKEYFAYQSKEPNTGWSILVLIPKF